jgi:hypothetical protein
MKQNTWLDDLAASEAELQKVEMNAAYRDFMHWWGYASKTWEIKIYGKEVRTTYWPGDRKHYYGFVDECRVPHPCGHGWLSGFDAEEVEADLKHAVDTGAL